MLTSFATVGASHNIGRAVSSHVLALAVLALHGQGAVSEHVSLGAARADQRIGALGDEVTSLSAVAAASRGGIGAVLAHVALLLAVAALTTEDPRVGAIGLAVAVMTS